MIKWTLLGLVLLFIPLAFASDGCIANDNCTWYAYGVTGTGVNISFTYPDGNTSSEYEMVNVDTGIYLYTTTFNVTTNILGCAREYNSTATMNIACESKEIYADNSETVLEEFNMLNEILLPFLIFLIGAILVYLGIKGEVQSSHIWTMSGGVWWLGSAAYMVFTGAIITSLFYVLLGIATIMIGISNLNEKEE